MRRLLCATTVLCALAPSHPRAEARAAARVAEAELDAHGERVAKLRDRLNGLLKEKPLSRTRVGVMVMQLSDGNVLYEHNPQVPFNPASNTKMLTTAAALTYLGPGYRYHTALYGPEPDGQGVVHGDVVLRGSGDPSLGTKDLAEIAHGLAARGVTRIEGDLSADPRFHDPARSGDADAGIGDGALILNRNAYFVRVRPGDAGHAALVSIEPRSDFFGVENQAKTVKGKRSRLRIDAYRKDDRLIVTVRGRIAESRGDYVDVRRLGDGALYSAAILKNALSDFGVELTGKITVGPVRGGTLLAEHGSQPLADISRISNKPSNNFVADAIYKTLGGELYGLPGTLEKGTRAVVDFLGASGIRAGAVKLVNGSGLTHENRITAHDLTRLLARIYRDPQVAPDFLSSLAVAGIDGTIRNRFLGSDAVGLVRAKTGTLSGVSALSGYVGDKDDVLVFSIFVEGFRNRRTTEVRHAQVRMVEAMLRFLRADAPGPGSSERPEAGVDYESNDADPELKSP